MPAPEYICRPCNRMFRSRDPKCYCCGNAADRCRRHAGVRRRRQSPTTKISCVSADVTRTTPRLEAPVAVPAYVLRAPPPAAYRTEIDYPEDSWGDDYPQNNQVQCAYCERSYAPHEIIDNLCTACDHYVNRYTSHRVECDGTVEYLPTYDPGEVSPFAPTTLAEMRAI